MSIMKIWPCFGPLFLDGGGLGNIPEHSGGGWINIFFFFFFVFLISVLYVCELKIDFDSGSEKWEEPKADILDERVNFLGFQFYFPFYLGLLTMREASKNNKT